MLNVLFMFHVVTPTTLDVQGGGSVVGILTCLQFLHLVLLPSFHTKTALCIFVWLLDVDLF